MRRPVGDGAAVRALEQALLSECLQVAAHGGVADAELGREIGDGDGAVARQELEDAAETRGLAHPAHSTEHRMLACDRNAGYRAEMSITADEIAQPAAPVEARGGAGGRASTDPAAPAASTSA